MFQELTRFPVLLEMDIDLFMSTGQYVMEGNTEFIAYSFNSGWIAESQIDETNKEIMVQSVQEVLEGLIQVEKDRIEKWDKIEEELSDIAEEYWKKQANFIEINKSSP